MAKFLFKQQMRRFVLKSAGTVVLPNPQGIPMAVNEAGKVIEVKGGELVTDDPEVIARIRRDPQFGTEEIIEITEDDEAAIRIRKKKEKEADEEIDTTIKKKKK